MDSSATQYELKLRKLLSKFLEPGYRLGNDVYLNILLSHLSGKNNQGERFTFINLTFCVASGNHLFFSHYKLLFYNINSLVYNI